MAEEATDHEALVEKPWLKWVFIAVGTFLVLALTFIGVWASGLLDSDIESEEQGEPKPATVNEVVNLEPIVVNLVGGKTSYARIGIAFGVFNPTPGTALIHPDLMIPKIKDCLLNTVGQMTPEQLLQKETKTELKTRIAQFVNGLLPEESGEVVEIYFTDFIVQ